MIDRSIRHVFCLERAVDTSAGKMDKFVIGRKLFVCEVISAILRWILSDGIFLKSLVILKLLFTFIDFCQSFAVNP